MTGPWAGSRAASELDARVPAAEAGALIAVFAPLAALLYQRK